MDGRGVGVAGPELHGFLNHPKGGTPVLTVVGEDVVAPARGEGLRNPMINFSTPSRAFGNETPGNLISITRDVCANMAPFWSTHYITGPRERCKASVGEHLGIPWIDKQIPA